MRFHEKTERRVELFVAHVLTEEPRMKMPNWGVAIFALFDPAARAIQHNIGIRRQSSSDKLRTMLGWQPRDLKEMLESAADSMIEQKLV